MAKIYSGHDQSVIRMLTVAESIASEYEAKGHRIRTAAKAIAKIVDNAEHGKRPSVKRDSASIDIFEEDLRANHIPTVNLALYLWYE
jgi:hypothetical protein